MDYPGDQQQPGGWGSSSRPSQSPYGPGEDRDDHGQSSHDAPHGGGFPSYDAPSDPPWNSGHGAESDDPYGAEPQRPYAAQQRDDFGGSQDGSGGGRDDFGGPRDGFGTGDGFRSESGAPYGGPGPYEPAADSRPEGYPDDGFRRSGGGKKKALIIGAAAVAGVVVIGGAAMALGGGGGGGGGNDKPPALATGQAATTPSTKPNPTPTETGKGDRLKSRATDPSPLTLNEVFRARRFKSKGRIYLMTTRRTDRQCAAGVHGVTFRKIITRGRCTQVLRATFTNGKFVGTIGVLNLRTQAAANAAQAAARPKDSFVVPVPGAGTTKKLGHGLSLTTAQTDGHYLILSWVEYPDGKRIATKDYTAVTAFVESTTYGSNLRPALNYRSMEGKPS